MNRFLSSLGFLGCVLACGGARSPAPEVQLRPLEERWCPYLNERIGRPCDAVLEGDLNGDGATDAVVYIEGGPLLVMTDTTTDKPERWEVLDVGVQKGPVRIDGATVILESAAPLRIQWRDDRWVFEQEIPVELEAQAAQARKHHPKAFEPGLKWVLDSKGFDGEADLEQHFVADFDGDRALELVIVDPRGLTLYEQDGQPHFYSHPWPARRAMVHFGGDTFEPFPGEPGAPVTVKTDFLELIVPEAASKVQIYKGKGRWEGIQQGD